ncbi:MAG: SpoIIE family protein phosphatase [Lachnospiraceae bacterium]|nr:SpoIIE family protein phosphatase [Lachnospiraceae bacterium]
MPGWILAMLVISLFLIGRDMAKTVYMTRKSRADNVVYEKHPQKEQMERYAHSFQKLANTFYSLPYRKEHLSNGEMLEIMDACTSQICVRCAKHDSCWELCYHLTLQQVCELLKAYEEGEPEKTELIQADWMLHCVNGARFLELLKQYFFRSKQALVWNNKLIENRLAVAEQLNEVAHIMQRTADDIYSISTVPENLEEQVCRMLRKKHVAVKKIWMLEKPSDKIKLYLTVRTFGGQCVTLHEVAKVLSQICQTKMMAVQEGRTLLNGEYTTVLFIEEVNYRVLYGVAKVTRDQEKISGDSYTCADCEESFLMCLSDGMGSGLDANRESETVVELMEEYLASGFSKETAARMINSALVLQRGDGMFSTVDLCSVNLYSGVCDFLKAGACTTFIKRDQWVEAISSTSIAAGLTQQLDYDTATKKVYDGDYIIMVTDGVLDALPLSREEEVMKEIILKLHSTTPKELGRSILEHVMSYCSYEARDDMTVLVAGVWKK